MKIFQNKKIWQKIVVALVFVILFQFVVTSPAHAVDADVLLEPVTNLFVSLADGIEGLLQTVVMQLGEDSESIIKISGDNDFWAKVIVIAVFVVGTVAAIIAAIPSGGTSLAWIPFAAGALLKITLATGICAITFNVTTKIVGDTLGATYYLPMFEISPHEIFANKVLLFDVNFFNPQDDVVTVNKQEGKVIDLTEDQMDELLRELSRDQGVGLIDWSGSEVGDNKSYGLIKKENGRVDWDKVVTACENIENTLGKITEKGKEQLEGDGELEHYNRILTGISSTEGVTVPNNFSLLELAKLEQSTQNNRTTEEDKQAGESFLEDVQGVYGLKSLLNTIKKYPSFNEDDKESEVIALSTAGQLQSIVASWYKSLRNIALVALLSILVYIGIRIIISSTSSEKAKYKQMLGDWVVAICLLFMMHYIMAFSMTIVEKVTNMIESMSFEDENTHEILQKIPDASKEYMKEAVELFIIDGTAGESNDDKAAEKVKNAYKALVKEHNESSNEYKNYFFTDSSLATLATDENNAKVLVWPANNFMEQARMRLQFRSKEGNNKVIMYGYSIIYVVLVIYTLIFCFTYLKRVIYMAFLTIIAPLVAVTYPIDKINDGKAQAFDAWMKEYIFNLLIQPLHLMLYFILIGSAMSFASRNIFYVVLALGFFVPAEKLLRRFFGFEKAQTPGLFAGAAGSALMMSGLNKLMHPKPPKGGLGSGGSNSSKEDEETTKAITRRDKGVDSTNNLVGIGDGDNADDDDNTNVPTGGREKNGNPLLDAYDENYGTDGWDAQERDRLARASNNSHGMSYSDDEYRQILRDSGYSDQEIAELMRGDNNANRSNSNLNSLNNSVRNNGVSTNTLQPKRKRSIRRAIGRAGRNYGSGMKKKLQARYKAKGGIGKRTIRMAAGLAGAGTLAAAGGIIGITSGDPSKAVQYMAAGAAGGYTLGKGAVNSAADTLKVEGTIKEAEKGYYGDDYKEVQRKKDMKKFMKDEENLRKIEDKLKVERKDAKRIMEEDMGYYLEQGGYDIEDLIALYGLEKETGLSKKQVDSIGQLAIKGMNGEDTRYMTSKKKNEYRNTFIPKFIENGSQNPEKDVDKVFDYVDRYHTLKN